MNIKEIWTEKDFEEMGWHDSHIHAIFFPNEDLTLSLDIDYLFEWDLDNKLNQYNFWVSPCILYFFNVLNLKIFIDFQDTIGLDIVDLNRKSPHLSPDRKMTLWDFEIITDKGDIKFESSGYRQVIIEQPTFSKSHILGRAKCSHEEGNT